MSIQKIALNTENFDICLTLFLGKSPIDKKISTRTQKISKFDFCSLTPQAKIHTTVRFYFFCKLYNMRKKCSIFMYLAKKSPPDNKIVIFSPQLRFHSYLDFLMMQILVFHRLDAHRKINKKFIKKK